MQVAASVVANRSAFWPPSLPDSVETIAASYVQPGAQSAVRLFNLSPDTKQASMSVGGKSVVNGVAYSLGSKWAGVPSTSESFAFADTSTGKALTAKTETPPKAPIGATNFLLGEQAEGTGAFGVQVVPLNDAPEGGKCHPSSQN